VTRPALPSFDLVVGTVGRTTELDALLTSLAGQTHRGFRVLVVDQNEDGRVVEVLGRHDGLEIERLRSERGLSRARNLALAHVAADVVAFPDDDCTYAPTLLADVAARFSADPGLDGLVGRTVDARGRVPERSKDDRAVLTDDNLWNRGSSATMFLRRALVQRIGAFDERLGVGSGAPASSAEEIDYLVRAVRRGARIEYEPSLLIGHERRVDDPEKGLRDGSSVGYLLGKHRYPARVVARMLLRPVGGALLSLVRLELPKARYHMATLRGRVRGYLAARRSKSSA
jgi:GT2 family glycosyltransferase